MLKCIKKCATSMSRVRSPGNAFDDKMWVFCTKCIQVAFTLKIVLFTGCVTQWPEFCHEIFRRPQVIKKNVPVANSAEPCSPVSWQPWTSQASTQRRKSGDFPVRKRAFFSHLWLGAGAWSYQSSLARCQCARHAENTRKASLRRRSEMFESETLCPVTGHWGEALLFVLHAYLRTFEECQSFFLTVGKQPCLIFSLWDLCYFGAHSFR